MIVYRPDITEDGERIRVSSRVEVESSNGELPSSLWFTFPRSYRGSVTDRTDAFAVTLLPLAMSLGEDLRVRGTLSPRLLRGMQDYVHIQTQWRPTPFRPVEITFDSLEGPRAAEVRTGVGCAFSGGVDSFYTLWSHLPQNERNPAYWISHCIMVNGFDKDSDLEGSGHFARIQRAYEPMMDRLGVTLIVACTNFMQFSGQERLKYSFAALVTAPALVLGRLLSCFLIAAGTSFHLYRDGSHPLFDHLIATETLEVVHDALDMTRVEKTAVLSSRSPALRPRDHQPRA